MKKESKHSGITKTKISGKLKLLAQTEDWRNKVKHTFFKKGQTPWNKGKSVRLSPDSEFKKGQFVGKDHPSWKGGVQVAVTDCAYLWTGVNKRVRRPRHIYEEAHGKIPKGYVIYHKDGDKHNDDIDNLISVSRAKMLELNRNKNGKTK